MNIKFTDLPFYTSIFNLTEAMQYSLSDNRKITNSSSNYQKQNHEYWFKQVITLTNGHTVKQIENYKKEYKKEFEKNPLLLGILDLYLNVYNASYDYHNNFLSVEPKPPFLSPVALSLSHIKNFWNITCPIISPFFTSIS